MNHAGNRKNGFFSNCLAILQEDMYWNVDDNSQFKWERRQRVSEEVSGIISCTNISPSNYKTTSAGPKRNRPRQLVRYLITMATQQ